MLLNGPTTRRMDHAIVFFICFTFRADVLPGTVSKLNACLRYAIKTQGRAPARITFAMSSSSRRRCSDACLARARREAGYLLCPSGVLKAVQN